MKKVLLFLVLLTSPALAQQNTDTAFLQKAIVSLQNQRNNALDALTVAEARVANTADDLNKANTKIKELEDKIKGFEEKKDPPKDTEEK